MNSVRAIGFDLFNTLLTVHPLTLREAAGRLLGTLHEAGIPVAPDLFRHEYVEAATRHVREAVRSGKETNNRIWIADALGVLGHRLQPEDPRIEESVEAYFSAFYSNCSLIPGTLETLDHLAGRYRLGLLSNFTHAPAAKKILDLMGLTPRFRTVLISGELGFRKPHPMVFARLVEQLCEPAECTMFVGDDPEADVDGARDAGLMPVLTTAVQDANIPSAQTVMSPSRTDTPPDVPRISCWEDLLALLES